MKEAVQIKTYQSPAFDINEAIRYLGDKNPTEATVSLIEKRLPEVEGELMYKVAYRAFDVSVSCDAVEFPFVKIYSKNLAKCLFGCTRAIVFCATVGPRVDRLILKYSSILPSVALTVDAIATERVEALCDAFCDELRQSGVALTPRFSPGYGDLPLIHQRDIFCALDLPGKIGVTLNESLLMSPSKSVTAIAGIKPGQN